ncbi:hypothetical protein [Marinobacter sp. X15-166B]|uniref:hypothetical protein n=1 Tax=Marinobacter sp. X15-166B TaxID=1897620 RepID=UPI00085CDC8D|nr:hypothetical protein [Marinobacter sp. X15-166B]OEY66214.1 hypothetical protein BG841_06920 [Marinobacter sp. X15-166B]
MTLPNEHALSLGALMCEVTRETLWQPAADWIHRRAANSRLRCRVGSGQATYHRFDPRNHEHLITYGVRMIADKSCATTAVRWLSSREIRQRGYFDGELSWRNLLAHTCCHEFAHLLQQVAGQRLRGSVHNRYFYQILDELHASGAAAAVRARLTRRAADTGVALTDTVFQPVVREAPAVHWQVGDPVTFGQPPRLHRGHIIRVNRKTCTVAGTGAGQGVRYRVPFALLRTCASRRSSGTPDH